MKIKEAISRLSQIVMYPNDAWTEEKSLDDNAGELLNNFLTPVLITSAFLAFIGISIQSSNNMWLAFRHFLAIIITGNFGALAIAYAVSKLSPSFGGESDFTKSFKLVIFSSFIYLLAISFSKVFPSIRYLFLAASLYGMYIFFVGSEFMLKIQQERKVGFTMVSFLVFVLIFFLLDLFSGIFFALTVN